MFDWLIIEFASVLTTIGSKEIVMKQYIFADALFLITTLFLVPICKNRNSVYENNSEYYKNAN